MRKKSKPNDNLTNEPKKLFNTTKYKYDNKYFHHINNSDHWITHSISCGTISKEKDKRIHQDSEGF